MLLQFIPGLQEHREENASCAVRLGPSMAWPAKTTATMLHNQQGWCPKPPRPLVRHDSVVCWSSTSFREAAHPCMARAQQCPPSRICGSNGAHLSPRPNAALPALALHTSLVQPSVAPPGPLPCQPEPAPHAQCAGPAGAPAAPSPGCGAGGPQGTAQPGEGRSQARER